MPVEEDVTRKDRGLREGSEREKLAIDRKGQGEGEESLDSKGSKVNRLRKFER